MSFFQRFYDVMPSNAVIGMALGLFVLVLWFGYEWLARRSEVRREECRAEEAADAAWEAKRAAYDKARAGGLIALNHRTIGGPPDVAPVSRETRKPLRRKNVRRKTRHK